MRAVVRAESWPIAGGFRIARGARTTAEVVVLELEADQATGRGECVPYGHYGESVDAVCADIEACLEGLNTPPTRESIQTTMHPGAARNAVDCALWDLEAKRTGKPAWELAGLSGPPLGVHTMRTVSVGSPRAMAAAAEELAHVQTIKVKVDGNTDLARIQAVHAAAPEANLVVDANESWTRSQLRQWLPRLADLGVVVLEQPLPANDDDVLGEMRGILPFCADESFHDRRSLQPVAERYDMVNIKLDKAGGLTEALACQRAARERQLGVMVGCMVCTSLAIEPALLLAMNAEYVDLDGPFLLDEDREGAAHEERRSLLRASPSLWGGV